MKMCCEDTPRFDRSPLVDTSPEMIFVAERT